jgi:lipoprotein NlpI
MNAMAYGSSLTLLNKMNISPARQKLIVYVILTVVTLAVYGQVNHYDFINFDDTIYVTGNSHVRSGITFKGLIWAFGTTYAAFWHPLTWLSLMLDYEIYGLNAAGFHLTNLILHLLSTLLLFRLFCRMTGSVWRSAFVAAFFAVHPLHVESVAWIAERKDVLSVFFWILTLCLYVYYTEKPVLKRYALVLGCLACALMSKSMAVTLPVIMILLDYWPLRRFEAQINKNLLLWQIKEKGLFFFLSIIFVVITFYHRSGIEGLSLESPIGLRFANAPVSLVTYLVKTFWPVDLSVFYPVSKTILTWQVAGASVLILFITGYVITVMKKRPYLFTGWLWYAVTILPVIGIIQTGQHLMADRYTYITLNGIGIMLAWGIPDLFHAEKIRKNILYPAGITFLAILAVLAWQQCGNWKNNISLFGHSLQVTKNNYLAHNHLAAALSDGKTEEALYHYNEAIRIFPLYAEAYINRGNVYSRMGKYQNALEDFSKVILLEPGPVIAYNNRGVVYVKLGQYRQAIEDFNKVIKLQENYFEAYCNRGFAYAGMNLYQPALEDYIKAATLKPDNAYAFKQQGMIYFKKGNHISGCNAAKKACSSGDCTLLEFARDKGTCR